MTAISREEYLRNPCRASSLPYWKTKKTVVPDNMLVIRDDVFCGSDSPEYEDTPYFRLIHTLDSIERPVLGKAYTLVSAAPGVYARHIQECYGGEIAAEALQGYRDHPVYDPDLWIAIADTCTGKIAASGIAELDMDIREGVLEWIQVSPAYRRQGLGRFTVRELLWRLKDKASFVTVSGSLLNPAQPLALYETCGFGGKVIWHVLSRRK